MTMTPVRALARGKGSRNFIMGCYGWSIRLLWLFLVAVVAQDDKSCAWNDCSSLEEMTVNVGHGNETALVYVSPDISTFYQEPPGSRKILQPNFKGMFGKFINLSPDPVRVYWLVPQMKQCNDRLIRLIHLVCDMQGRG